MFKDISSENKHPDSQTYQVQISHRDIQGIQVRNGFKDFIYEKYPICMGIPI